MDNRKKIMKPERNSVAFTDTYDKYFLILQIPPSLEVDSISEQLYNMNTERESIYCSNCLLYRSLVISIAVTVVIDIIGY